MFWAFVFVYGFVGGCFRRWLGHEHGGPRIVKRLSGAVLAAIVVILAGYLSGLPLQWEAALAASIVVGIGWVFGHGSHMDMGESPVTTNEPYDLLLKGLFPIGSWGTVWYDFCGMAIRYGFVTTVLTMVLWGLKWANISMVILDPWYAGTGCLAAVWYLAFTKVGFLRRLKICYLNCPTAWGEFLTGATIYGALMGAML